MHIQNRGNQNCHYILSYHSDTPYVSLAIHGYTPTPEFQALSEHLLEALANYQTNKALVDIREMHLISAEDQRWLLESWVPRAMRIGHNACAVINSKHFFNRVAISSVAENVKAIDFNLQLFEEVDKAVGWLKEQ
jgi:hypothetical protein